jgi:hypothetical protein
MRSAKRPAEAHGIPKRTKIYRIHEKKNSKIPHLTKSFRLFGFPGDDLMATKGKQSFSMGGHYTCVPVGDSPLFNSFKHF